MEVPHAPSSPWVTVPRNRQVVAGWTVLRFTWWQVMHEPDWVRACLRRVGEGHSPGANVG